MNKVCIAIPTVDGNIYYGLAILLIKWASQKTIPVEILVQPFFSPVECARNEIVRRFLLSDCTHLLMIDDDIVPPEDTLERLLFHDKMIAGAVCPVVYPKNGKLEFAFNAYHKENDGSYTPLINASSALHSVDAIGTGCTMFKREIFEHSKLLFQTLLDDTGKKWQGEDLNFCEEAKALDIEIFADFRLKCRHIKACDLLEIYDKIK